MEQEQDLLMKALVQAKRMGNLLNEVQDLTQQIAESVDRNDQVSMEMLVAMRREPINKLEETEQALRDLAETYPDAELALELIALINGEPATKPAGRALEEQIASNRRRLTQILQLDRVLNKRMAREKSVYQ